MRSSLIATKGLKLVRSPSVRAVAARRRLAVLGALAGLALLSVAVGYATASRDAGEAPVQPSPFSYFPSE